jgi:hypothetical protein
LRPLKPARFPSPEPLLSIRLLESYAKGNLAEMNSINAKQIIGSIIVLVIGIGIFTVFWNDRISRNNFVNMFPQTKAQTAAEKDFPGICRPPIKNFNGYPSVREYLSKTLHDYERRGL